MPVGDQLFYGRGSKIHVESLISRMRCSRKKTLLLGCGFLLGIWHMVYVRDEKVPKRAYVERSLMVM